MPLKFDIDNENFNYFFLEQVMLMSEHQKELMPKDLLFKVFVKGFRVNTKSTSKLSFLSKLFILMKSLNKRWVLIIEDNDKGLNEEQYFKLKEETKKRNYTSDSATELISQGQFVLGNSELFETFHKLNHLSLSPAYHYLSKVRNKNSLSLNEYRKSMKFLSKWINNYESIRKKIVLESGLTMAEWITLTYLYDGEEKVGSYLYREKFKYCYNSSSAKIKTSFGTLQNRGYIVKYGISSGAKFQITALGKDKLSSVMNKYVVNC